MPTGQEYAHVAVCRKCAAAAVARDAETAARATRAARASLPGRDLTDREVEVLSLFAEGLTSREIAAQLWISENTAKRHLQRIREALGVSTSTAAVTMALRAGVIR